MNKIDIDKLVRVSTFATKYGNLIRGKPVSKQYINTLISAGKIPPNYVVTIDGAVFINTDFLNEIDTPT